MTLTEQIYAQALLLAGELEQKQTQLLKVLCQGADSSLRNRLREGLKPEDCKADFVAAASLFALAALSAADEESAVEMFQAGDLSLRRKGTDAASNCLRNQSQLMIAPYLKDNISFLGV